MTDHAKAACNHHTTLNTFAAVVTLLEGGTVYDPAANAAAQRIIKLCQSEQYRQLKKYDAALAALSKTSAVLQQPGACTRVLGQHRVAMEQVSLKKTPQQMIKEQKRVQRQAGR